MAAVRNFEPHIGAQRAAGAADEVIALLAARQHNLVAWWQMLEAGVGRRAIQRRIERGQLRRVHRGVFTVSHAPPSRAARWMAAVLAAGPKATLSHRSGGSLHCVHSSSWTEVTAPGRRRSRDGFVVHRALLPADEVTTVDGIPVTTVARTLLDLAAVLPSDRLEHAMNEAEARRLGDRVSLPDLLHRYPGRSGTRAIKAVLAKGRLGLEVTKEELEHLFKQYVKEIDLGRPLFNVWIEGYECDVVWPETR